MNQTNKPALSRDLLLRFFLTFARFEFALKNAGYAAGNEREVAPDWGTFARSIRDDFECEHSPALDSACAYMLDSPPLKQVLLDGNLAWSAAGPGEDMSAPERLLVLVCRVRNNLFHGGKHSAGLFEDAARQQRLLESSLVILDECLRVQPRVKQAYASAAI